MEILRCQRNGTFKVVGKRCDRCGYEVRAFRSLDDELQMQEFVRVEVHAGYMAHYFSDGDSWAADLCEKCVFTLHGDHLRLARSYEEGELESAIRSGCSETHLDEYRQFARERRLSLKGVRAREQ